MRLLKLLLILVAIVIGFSVPFVRRYLSLHRPLTFPPLAYAPPSAPSAAIKAQVSSSSGLPLKHPRYSSAYLPMAPSDWLVQGEGIRTDASSSASLGFSPVLSLQVKPNTVLDFTNGVLPNLLLTQSSGEIEYQPTTADNTIRAAHLLVHPASGLTITFDSGYIYLQGLGQIAYEDLSNVTHIVDLRSNRRLRFNDSNRTYRFIR
ncbi:hypothetical protein M1116_01075 [Patescibacteria group bacterium]|nr:hypothetical protein [Patescibacteria group bacterium]